ncbi:helix-turn-helix domain-containing protein [Lactobacillus sp. LL6]|uniref:helix-turn-helix domain-containing protein n=1 Tax=Lactobacillus sp. LL6 TaxID=2596827 RepID=UPI00118503AD|nr:helix-turn-helix domain-containing protein [Lactobacillus sp. LL6]TSO26298.1 XRE family transcriptional regulator [Lactobacillus sp. LL6]
MTTTISAILNNNNLTVADIASKSGVARSTLGNAIKKPIESWSIRVLNAFAKGLGMQSPDLLSKLQSDNYELKIDDKHQMIQGIQISDKELYQQVKFAVVNNHLEGWQPTRDDILYLLKEVQNPDPEFDEMYRELFENE